MSFQLPKLPYSYDALEPIIDSQTMEIHHSKHHQGYVDKLNKTLEKYEKLNSIKIEDLMRNLQTLVPEEIKQSVRNFGGGVINHNQYWKILSPDAKIKPKSELLDAIEKEFQNFDNFKKIFEKETASQFGSGWGWLIADKNKNLDIITTSNQDTPLSMNKNVLFGIDVWEHAYYLKYQNKRAKYLSQIWEVLNWEYIEKLYIDL